MPEVTLHVERLTVQKDEYEVGGQALGETEFWSNPANEANVEGFKRLKATCRLSGPFDAIAFTIHVMLRGGYFRILGIQGNATPADLAKTVVAFLGPRAEAVVLQCGESHALCMVRDVNWLASTLHEAKVEGGLSAGLAPDDLAIPMAENQGQV